MKIYIKQEIEINPDNLWMKHIQSGDLRRFSEIPLEIKDCYAVNNTYHARIRGESIVEEISFEDDF